MSFFTVICAWCGQTFTTGIVGRSPVGSGHTCKVRKPCAEPGCRKNSVVQVEVAPGERELRCADHIHGGVAAQWQVTGRA